MKIPVHIGSYLASISNRLLRRNRAPLDRTQFDSDECVSLDHGDPLLQTSNERYRSEGIAVPSIPIRFAIPGGTNQTFDNGPFSEPIDPNNNAAAWMVLGVAISAFALVFGGYVAIAGMGNPAATLRRAEAMMPRTVMGMAWLPGDLAAFPELPAPAAPAISRELEADLFADRQLTLKKESTAPGTPARERARAPLPAARTEATLRADDECTNRNQRGCFRKYPTKAPPGEPFGGTSNGPRRVQRDFDQPMQWHSEAAAAPSSTTYLHH
jgi:hypothetical protein